MAGYIELYRLGKTYPTQRGPAVIVENFNLDMHEREVVALIGHSGCGKSTVLNMVAGLIEPTHGSVAVALRETTGPGPDRGVVFQSPSLLPWMTAYDNVRLGVDRVFPSAKRKDRDAIIKHCLANVGLGSSMFQRASNMSQGMQQRVGIARALAISPKMLLLDEPFGMLDSLTRMELQEVVLDLLNETPCPTLMVTHDVDEALFMADRVVMMTTGPAATIGRILDIPFARPRRRHDVLEHPEYYSLREELITFLEDQHTNTSKRSAAPPAEPTHQAPISNGEGSTTTKIVRTANASGMLKILPAEPADASPLVHTLLADQSQLTAVERFSQKHETSSTSHHQHLYRDLIPLSEPGPGQQYAFVVDLDACSGCKACVTACHEANGLEDAETWRDVGLLVGGFDDFSFLQHVTTACHHCVDPACLSGCPVNAYDKDAITGIVRHLDDQCIGCQYCIWTCPYEVPRFSKTKGIVRKCDMCRQRLAANDAPACVQSCPNQAIRIEVIDQATAVKRGRSGRFLEGTPDPRITLPTTKYLSNSPKDFETTAADRRLVKSDHAHGPLVFMLVMTQSAVGLLTTDVILRFLQPASEVKHASFLISLLAGSLFFAGMNLVMLHLGRPLFAFRAFLGWRTSWLSREVIAFGAFISCWTASIAARGIFSSDHLIHRLFDGLILAAGAIALVCSGMIYIKTARVNWGWIPTTIRFGGTLIGVGLVSRGVIGFFFEENIAPTLVTMGALTLLLKIVAESIWILRGEASHDEQRNRIFRLISGSLRNTERARVLFSVVGFSLLWGTCLSMASPATPGIIGGFLIAGTLLVLAGELVERLLYFQSVAYRGMPGVIGR